MREKAVVGYTTRPISLEIGGGSVTALTTDVNSPLYSQRAWYFDPFISYTTRLGKDRRLTARLNVKNVLNLDDITAVSKISSTANTINVNDPRLTYYGWTDPMMPRGLPRGGKAKGECSLSWGFLFASRNALGQFGVGFFVFQRLPIARHSATVRRKFVDAVLE